jgi:hypothetical protein
MMQLCRTRLKQALKRLTSTLPHLPALAPESAHTLLAPLVSHASIQVNVHSDSVELVDESRQLTIGQNSSATRQPHAIGGNELDIFNSGLEIADGRVLRHRHREGAGHSADENLHSFRRTSGCSESELYQTSRQQMSISKINLLDR